MFEQIKFEISKRVFIIFSVKTEFLSGSLRILRKGIFVSVFSHLAHPLYSCSSSHDKKVSGCCSFPMYIT